VPNPNRTVLEWLNAQADFADKVAAVASWDVFPAIINTERSGMPVNVGPLERPRTDEEVLLQRLHGEIPQHWPTVRHDAFTHQHALAALRHDKPRVLYIAYGETDDFAHDGRYDQVLHAAARTDGYLRELWETLQADDYYRDSTVLLLTTDHGRGESPLETWQHHASKASLTGYMQSLAEYEDGIVGSDAIWIAGVGPGIAAQGLVATQDCAGANQIASTLLRLLGRDWQDFNAAAGAPLTGLLVQP
jgi:arylsulfatase A-like enzyme